MNVRVTKTVLTSWKHPDDKLEVAAYASVRIEDASGFSMWIRSLRLIRRPDGSTFLRFPAEPVSRPCGSCGHKNDVAARFCNDCGVPLETAEPGRYDLVNPDNSATRDVITAAVVREYHRVCGVSTQT